ncbi:hypothetical protein BJY24_002464 [Nocardia transvalensis]|uniref:Uncharacterized protein n=1 Tax=Nocardia transvalensis TaxID=37333 RepID=A0A7W9PCF4_9NOCA|nr:hypothetical protein [Nocardia transvalensis]
MRPHPTALAWLDPNHTVAPEWDSAQIRKLARRLGYALLWPPDDSTLDPADIARQMDVDAVIVPAPTHLTALALNRLMNVADVESANPRCSFARWRVGTA